MAISNKLKNRAKSAIDTGRLTRMHLKKRAEARNGLKVLERARGPLAKSARREATDYANDVLGWQGYVDWLLLYTAVAGEFRDGWIPDNFYYSRVMPAVNGSYLALAKNRGCNALVFGASNFPDVAYHVNGIWYGRQYNPIPLDQLLRQLVEVGEAFVFKADALDWGKGITFLNTEDLSEETLARLGNGVLQRRVVSHAFFDQFQVPSVATLRLATVITDQAKPDIRACYLKIGRKQDKHVIAADQLRVAVNWKTGAFSDQAYMSDWQPVTAHPDTGIGFAGLVFPEIRKCAETVLAAHAKMPLTRFVCWDLAIDSAGEVKILEWEGGVVSFAEAVQGPCFADLDWVRFTQDQR